MILNAFFKIFGFSYFIIFFKINTLIIITETHMITERKQKMRGSRRLYFVKHNIYINKYIRTQKLI